MFICLTNDTTYLTGNEGQKFRAVFSENAPLQGYSGSSIVRLMLHSRPFLSLRKIRMRIIRSRGGKRPFCFSFGEKTSDGLQFCMPPSKVCPQCETKAESVLLVSAVQGFCCFCSLPYTFRYVFVNACASSSHTCKNSSAHPSPNISAEGLHFSAFSFCYVVYNTIVSRGKVATTYLKALGEG